MASDGLPLSLRAFRDTDRRFIVHSWLKSFGGSRVATLVEPDAYYRDYRKLIERALSRSRVLVACQPDDDDAIIGWTVVEPRNDRMLVHYVYVKHPFRRFGVAKTLLAPLIDKPATYTHVNGSVRRMPIPSVWKYSLFAFFLEES